MRVLIDTSCAIETFRCTPAALQAVTAASFIAIDVFTLGELLTGVGLKRPTVQLASIVKFRARSELLLPTERTAETYASIQRALAAAGLPISQNDAWIAATAIEHDLTLLTFDRHFARVEGLNRVILSAA